MKKRLLSILLVFCMMMSFMPITVFAAGGAKAILPGTSAQSILKIDKSRLSFAGHEWWVIGQKTDKSNNAPIITLLAVNNDFGDVPFRTGSDGPFENARRYSEDNGYYANNPSGMSQWRKPNEYAGSTLQQKMVSLAEAIPEKEQAVIRPKDITEGITGQEVKAQKLWAFSQEDSIYLYRNSCKYAAQWWTRSSNEVYGYGSWTIHPDGRSGSALNVDYDAAVRPAMEMDLSSVLFISAAEHGKVADLTTPIAEYAGDEWKLTLHDSDRDDFTAKTVLVNGSVLEVEYKNAKVGDNEYISAVIKDADGSISRYTRVVQLDGTTNGTRGRAAIDLTGIDMTGKTLCVFNEQFNGDYKTDYAGALREVKLTDEIDEQFTLKPGGRYYFDLSAMDIPGTENSNLPDSTRHYVPFTYAGTVNAYKLTSETATTEEYAQKNKYDHSLFVADYNVTHTVSWNTLNTADLIFGKDYASGGVGYTLRAPSVGSSSTGSGDSQRGTPQSNEWDTMLNKNSGYIQNWNEMYSRGQDTFSGGASFRADRGYFSARYWRLNSATSSYPYRGFRPVLEVLNPDTLGSGGLKVVTLDLGGGKLGGSSEDIQIIVKNGSEFTAPASGGLTRPDGNTGSYFMWLGSNGKLYAPGDNVPADVTKLTAQFAPNTYTVTLNTNGGTINSGNVTEYTYGVGATLPTADDMTYTGYTFKGWYDNENLTGSPVTAISDTETGNKEYWAKWEANAYTVTLNTNGGTINSGNVTEYTYGVGATLPTADDMTYTGYTFKGWYDNENLTGSPVTAISDTETGNKEYWAKWEINQYTITVKPENGKADITITQDYGTQITAPTLTREGYQFNGWDKTFPTTMPAENMTITAKWKVNQYTITFDTAGGSEIAPITQDYGTPITAPTLTREGYQFNGWDKAFPTTMPAENLTITAKWRDIAVPTGEIKIAENGWKSFLNTITFGLFFKDTQTVTVTATDNSGETVTIEYLLSDKALTESELAGMTFTAYSAPFSINPDNEYVIYAKLTDTSGNVAYINTNGIVLDGTSPVITGIENGKTYCESQTVTIDEKYIDTVTVNGTAVELDENNSFILPADGEQKIIVTDKAGNTAEMTVTVNGGHTFGEWASNGDGTHSRECTVDGCNGLETKDCSGGKATCTEKAVCEYCGKAYGKPDSNNHTDLKHIDAKAATKTAEGNIEYWYCGGCDKYYSDKYGINEIKKADTVTAKLPGDPKSPRTGNASDLALWISLLFVSGGVTGVTAGLRKKKKHKV